MERADVVMPESPADSRSSLISDVISCVCEMFCGSLDPSSSELISATSWFSSKTFRNFS